MLAKRLSPHPACRLWSRIQAVAQGRASLLIGEQMMRYRSLLQHSPFCVCLLCRGRAYPHIGVDSGEGRTSKREGA
ncbi:hypothetical protein, partial [Mesorhizobium sp. M2D.F.Ca.ET.178.01.1.1]|uniref:hypothetical protein n=1 Tax=Mesorhizobium sp. M2D.F.Ca.ET.178.01.1.1 TaxID=2563937 RepID=UPI001AED244C